MTVRATALLGRFRRFLESCGFFQAAELGRNALETGPQHLNVGPDIQTVRQGLFRFGIGIRTISGFSDRLSDFLDSIFDSRLELFEQGLRGSFESLSLVFLSRKNSVGKLCDASRCGITELGEFFHAFFHALFDGGFDRTIEEVLERRTAGLDQIAKHGEGHPALSLLFLVDDLGQRDGRQVLFGLVVDDLQVVTCLDHACDLVERDVFAPNRVVKLTIRISLDDLDRGLAIGRRGCLDRPVMGYISTHRPPLLARRMPSDRVSTKARRR